MPEGLAFCPCGMCLRPDEATSIKEGRVFVAIDSNLGAVVGDEEGANESILGNEGRIAQAWVNVRGWLRIFVVYF